MTYCLSLFGVKVCPANKTRWSQGGPGFDSWHDQWSKLLSLFTIVIRFWDRSRIGFTENEKYFNIDSYRLLIEKS